MDQTRGGTLTSRGSYLARETSGIIKGTALVMMFLHHFFTFPAWWDSDVSYPLLSALAPYLREPLRMCVPVFCFLTGYFYFFNTEKNCRYSLRKITDLLVSYWSALAPLAVIAAVCLGYRYTPVDFLKEMFALYRPTMCFGWYVYFYYLAMLLLPLAVRIMGRNIHIDLLLALIVFPYAGRIILKFVQNAIIAELLLNLNICFPVLLTGFIFARYGIFEKLEALNRRLIRSNAWNAAVWLCAALILMLGRWAEPSVTVSFGQLPVIHKTPVFVIELDVVYAPLFIYCLANLCGVVPLKYIKRGLLQIGKYSLLMWFVSCMFFGNCKALFRPVLYFPRNPVLVILWGLLLCYVISIPLDRVGRKINDAKNRLLFRRG